MKCIRCRQGKSLEWEKSQIRLDKEFRVEIYVFIYSPIPLGSCCNVNFSSLISCDSFYFLANDEIFLDFFYVLHFTLSNNTNDEMAHNESSEWSSGMDWGLKNKIWNFQSKSMKLVELIKSFYFVAKSLKSDCAIDLFSLLFFSYFSLDRWEHLKI